MKRQLQPVPVTSVHELLYFMGKGHALFKHQGIFILALTKSLLECPHYIVDELLTMRIFELQGVVVRQVEL